MSALDIITLQQAKDKLVVDFPDRDNEITQLIESAIASVEQYTDYRLYQRDETFAANCYETRIQTYPITITGVTNTTGTVSYTTKLSPLSLYVYAGGVNNTISATVGYENVADIPQPLISAAYKIIVYLFENKDAYATDLPIDVQMLLNQYRRSCGI